jgi:hypothetical protein
MSAISLTRKIIPRRIYLQLRAMTGDFHAQVKTGKYSHTENFAQSAAFAHGLLMATETAKQYGYKSIAVAEFGVFNGKGLRRMISMAERLSRQSGVAIKIYGFDTGTGQTPLQDWRDIPHIMSEGEFEMLGVEALRLELKGKAELVINDIGKIGNLSNVIDPTVPFGFASVDVDLYSSTMATFELLATGEKMALLPQVNLYIRDSFTRQYYSRFVAMLRAVNDFNRNSETRKIDIDRSISHWYGKVEPWHASMHVMHTLDYQGKRIPR